MKDDARVVELLSDEATMESIDAMDFSLEELQEFLAADLVEVQADPHFKERLRAKLWEVLKTRGTPSSR
jgi:hypothetical protein